MRLAIVPDGILRASRIARTAKASSSSAIVASTSVATDLPRRLLARAVREPVEADPSGQLGDPGAESSIFPQRAEPVVEARDTS
jgi:hypothetical protein